MTRHALWPLLGAVLPLAWMGPAYADNPKISLKIQDMPASEVVKKLSEATGQPIELSANTLAMEKMTFDWSSATLGRALRDLCTKLNLQPNKKPGGGYMLYVTGAPPAPAKPVGLAEKNGVKLSVRSLSLYESRYVNFAGPGNSFSSSNLNLQIGAELADGDGETVAGIENINGKDDLGNVLASPNQGGASYGGYSNQLPDEWLGSVTLGAPSPKARKIQWIEGDLMVYKGVKHYKAEIPVPLTAKSVRREAGSMLIVASRFQVLPKGEDEGDEADLPGPKGFNGNQQDFGPSVRVRTYTPVGARFSARNGGYGTPPVAVGESGRTYTGNTFRGGGTSSDGQWQVSDTTWIFPGMAEKPVKLVWEIVEKSDPVKLFSFRMSDIPLPDPPVAVKPGGAVRPAAPGNPAAPAEMPHPFYQKGGGTLVGAVALGSENVREGTLEIGLAARTAAGWGPVRWTEVVVGPDGTARLEEIKPGEYRIVRRYRGTASTTGGSWSGTELRLKIPAGKNVALPVLRWSAKPATVPAGGKPTVLPAPRK